MSQLVSSTTTHLSAPGLFNKFIRVAVNALSCVLSKVQVASCEPLTTLPAVSTHKLATVSRLVPGRLFCMGLKADTSVERDVEVKSLKTLVRIDSLFADTSIASTSDETVIFDILLRSNVFIGCTRAQIKPLSRSSYIEKGA
jgi:hypothetical protein